MFWHFLTVRPAIPIPTIPMSWSLTLIMVSISSMQFCCGKKESGIKTDGTIVPPYQWGIHPKTPSGSPKPQIVPNPVYTVFPTHTFLCT